MSKITVAIQGTKGSFHEQAAKQYFENNDLECVDCESFVDVFNAVKSEEAEYGVVAVENSLHGSINPVYRLLAKEGLFVCGEVRLQIKLYLIGCDNLGIDHFNVPITEVMSQREALSQCEQWISENLPNAKISETSDTAEAVKLVTKEYNVDKLAIASWEAAQLYNGEIIAGPINDESENYTRFFVISKKNIIPSGANRTSIILTEDSDRSGKLYDALGVFAKAGINLSKLDSHPRPGRQRLYAFYLDFDEASNSVIGISIIKDLKKLGWNVQILGSYISVSSN